MFATMLPVRRGIDIVLRTHRPVIVEVFKVAEARAAESAAVRYVRRGRHANVPFPHKVGSVAGRRQFVAYGCHVARDATGVCFRKCLAKLNVDR